MKTMKAIVFQEEKNLDSLAILEVPRPTPGEGQVLVEVKACALNRRDVWITQGLYPKIKVPVILGSDGAGVVSEVGPRVPHRWMGKAVIINPALGWGDDSAVPRSDFRILGLPDNGTQAQYVVVPANNLARKPRHLSFEQAAALPLGGLTGYRALFTRGGLRPGETVLITGIGGGVAAIMLQLALATGARVLVTSGHQSKIMQARKSGAAAGFNYREEGWVEKARTVAGKAGIDLIIDGAGGDGFGLLIDLVKSGGRIVSYGATAGACRQMNLHRLFWKQINILGTTMGSPQDFAAMVAFVERHQVVPPIDTVYGFSEFAAAYQRMLAAEQFGKIGLRPDF